MRLSVTTSFEMDGSSKASNAIGISAAVIARLVRAFVHFESLSAELEHFRHERHSVKLPLGVKRPQNLFLASNLYPVTDCELSTSAHCTLG
jgi:hypothetical protein